MKTLNLMLSVLVMACLCTLSGCFGPGVHPQQLRIKSFTWDEKLYQAQYDAYGRLLKLQANDRNVTFFYDEDAKLTKATINLNGQTTPEHLYTFTHGPHGITEVRISEYAAWDDMLYLTTIVKLNYLTPTKLSSLRYQEVSEAGGVITVGFELERLFQYSGNNVSRIYVEPPFTDYSASAYDTKKNPFMMLADAVGNPAFFPVGLMVNYPVVQYNIPIISLFSTNNPLKATYQIEGAPTTVTLQTFTNTYDGSLVKKIVWKSTYYNSSPATRTFIFDYERASCLPRDKHHGSSENHSYH